MSEVKKNITVVILTYAGRSCIYQVLEYLASKKSIKDIVIVSNGHSFKPPDEMKEFCHVINNKRNEGSAYGYRQGLSKAIVLKNRFTWLLDDDNLPAADSLEKLLNTWEQMKFSNRSFPVALQCYRTSQFAYKNIFNRGELNLLPFKNSFMGFHIRKLPRIIFNKIRQPPYSANYKKSLYPSNAAFYGGLFLETKTLKQIPLPNTDYFMYVDDLEFTHNIKKRGGDIFVLIDSVINDLDFSIEIEKKNRFLYHPIMDFSSNMKAFHYARNISYFTKSKLISNKYVYHLNKIMFLGIIRVISLIRGRKYRFKVLLSGVRVGHDLLKLKLNA